MRKLLPRRPALALALIVLPQLAARAVACSCFPLPTPYKSFADARAVFAGTVLGQRDAETKEGFTEHFFRFAVVEAFKGVSGGEVEISAGGDTSCYVGFSIGQTYLVYAFGNSDDALYTHMCSRTTSLASAADDVYHIRAHLNGVPEPRIYGAVTRGDAELRGGRSVSSATPLAGIKIVVEEIVDEGKGRRFEAVTDGHGRYSLAGVPDGYYKASPVVPARYRLHYPGEVEFTLRAGPHRGESSVHTGPSAYARFHLGWNNEISGRLLDAEGAPIVRAQAKLFALDASGSPLLVEEERYNLAEGKYQFQSLTPGRYLPAVTVQMPSGEGPREAQFFHPGTVEATRAGEVAVAAAAPSTGRDIRLPAGYVTRRITGVVIWSDGRPAKEAWVSLNDTGRPGDDGTVYSFERVDGQGRFSLQGFVGSDYWVHASPTMGDVKLDDGRDLWSAGVPKLWASPVKITVGRENAPVRLVLSLPKGLRLAPADIHQEKQR